MRIQHTALALLALAPLASAQVVTELQIAEQRGGFPVNLSGGAQFGASVANLGDLDGDGVDDLAVGSPIDSDGALAAGAVYVLFLNANGSVKSYQKISATAGGFGGTLGVGAYFGSALAGLGDLDGDGFEDLAVGSRGLAAGGTKRGGVWILFLNGNGTVKATVEITGGTSGFATVLENDDRFGAALTLVGDLGGDGSPELAVGAIGDDDGQTNAGAVYLLSLAPSGLVIGESKISATSGGLIATFAAGDEFGGGLGALEDLDGDGVPDLAVGMPRFDLSGSGGGPDTGQVFVLYMNVDGSVKSSKRITRNQGGFSGSIASSLFGMGIARGDDYDGDGTRDLLVGAPAWAESGGILTGATFVLFLRTDATVSGFLQISNVPVGFLGPIYSGDYFGGSVARVADFDGNGTDDVLVGALGTDLGGLDTGSAWILSLRQGLPVAAAFAERTGAGNLDGVLVLQTTGSFTPPRIGGTSRLQADTTLATGHDTALFFAFDGKVSIPTPNGWTLLCFDSGAGYGELLTGAGFLSGANAQGFARYAINWPNGGGLVGFELSIQSLLLDSTGTNLYEVTNAWDVTVGL